MCWHLSDHACRYCFGRLLCSEDGSVWRCAECGAQHRGSHEGICWCGVHVPGVGKPYRCVRQETSVVARQEVVVMEVTDVEAAANRC